MLQMVVPLPAWLIKWLWLAFAWQCCFAFSLPPAKPAEFRKCKSCACPIFGAALVRSVVEAPSLIVLLFLKGWWYADRIWNVVLV